MHLSPWLDFDQLRLEDLYAFLQLRAACFVVEQQSYYQDLDDHDRHAHHLLVWEDSSYAKLIGYVRVLQMRDASGAPTGEVSFGRLVVAPEARGSGLAGRLVAEAMTELNRRWGKASSDSQPPVTAVIEAQTYLCDFYGRYGFGRTGDTYMLDGLPHVIMAAEVGDSYDLSPPSRGARPARGKPRTIPTAVQ